MYMHICVHMCIYNTDTNIALYSLFLDTKVPLAVYAPNIGKRLAMWPIALLCQRGYIIIVKFYAALIFMALNFSNPYTGWIHLKIYCCFCIVHSYSTDVIITGMVSL